MTDLVDPADIERIVGRGRSFSDHYARYVASEDRIYILHSQQCVDKTPDLRNCPYSIALDDGEVVHPFPSLVPVAIRFAPDGRTITF